MVRPGAQIKNPRVKCLDCKEQREYAIPRGGQSVPQLALVVMACDDEVIPLQERIETVGDDADLQEVYDTERHLLYVACTRARDQLLVTGVDPKSEFLDDLKV